MTPMEADIMDITTLSAKTKSRNVVLRNISRKTYLAISLGALSPYVYALRKVRVFFKRWKGKMKIRFL